MMKLPEKQAKRIYARYYLGMKVNEIAEVEKPCPRQYPPWIKAACKIFLIKFHLMRLFFAFFVSVNKKDKFSSFISTFVDNRIDSTTGT